MTNLDELIYSYKYIKEMIKRIEKDFDDGTYNNLTPSEIYSNEADLHNLHKTMGKLRKLV